MSRFLSHLASLATGAPPPGAARLVLPPRFSGGGTETGEQGGPAVEAAGARRLEPRRPEHKALPPQMELPRRDTEPHVAKSIPTEPVEAPTSSDLSLPTAGQQLESRASKPALFPALPQRAFSGTETGRADFSPRLEHPISRTATDTPLRAETVAVRAPTPAAPVAPLSAAAVANRAAVERVSRPVVNVTIDRIEVRAPREAEQKRPERRAKPQPSVSLADYLGVRP